MNGLFRYSCPMSNPYSFHDGSDGVPTWDEAKAEKLLGAIVLVGITYVAPDRIQKKQFQCHGVVTQTLENRGIEIECHGQRWNKQKIWLPPDLKFFSPAAPGVYRLRETGEELVDPHFTAYCTIYLPHN